MQCKPHQAQSRSNCVSVGTVLSLATGAENVISSASWAQSCRHCSSDKRLEQYTTLQTHRRSNSVSISPAHGLATGAPYDTSSASSEKCVAQRLLRISTRLSRHFDLRLQQRSSPLATTNANSFILLAMRSLSFSTSRRRRGSQANRNFLYSAKELRKSLQVLKINEGHRDDERHKTSVSLLCTNEGSQTRLHSDEVGEGSCAVHLATSVYQLLVSRQRHWRLGPEFRHGSSPS